MSLSLFGALVVVTDAEGISGTVEAPRRVKNAIFSLKMTKISVNNYSNLKVFALTHLNEIMSGLFFSTFVLRNL